MKCSADGRAFLEAQELLVLEAYPDSRGIWTIGYGHTGPDVHKGLRWTREQADATFALDIAFAETALTGLQLTQGQFDALVSLIFNIGVHGFLGSTLHDHLVAHRFERAGEEFTQWKRAGADPDRNLRRRTREVMRYARG